MRNNLVEKPPVTPEAEWRKAPASIIDSVEGRSGFDTGPNLHLGIQKLFDLEMTAQANGADLDRYAGAGAYVSFLEAIDALPQPYLEEVEPGLIVASEVESIDEFFDFISVERLICYNCTAALWGDIDARPTVDTDLFSPGNDAFLTRWLADLLNPFSVQALQKVRRSASGTPKPGSRQRL